MGARRHRCNRPSLRERERAEIEDMMRAMEEGVRGREGKEEKVREEEEEER